jgi:hypothetical protein
VKKFFKNQKEQFDKAVHKLEIYEKNRTYVVDKDTIKIVEEIQSIVKSKEPYSEIHRLPNLIEEFTDKFVQLLEEECKPVRSVIESDSKRVLEELDLYDFGEELKSKFKARFDNLLSRLDSANNFYEAIAMKEESDRLKIRCFDEIEKEKAKRKPKPEGTTGPTTISGGETPVYKTKKLINVSIANILHGAKVIETEEDIEEVLDQIRRKLKEQLNEDIKLKLI